MMKYLFSNPKAALLFVIGTVLSTMLLIGSEDQEGLLSQAVGDVAEQREGFKRDIAELDQLGANGDRGPRVRVSDEPENQNWDEFNSDPIEASPMSDDSLIDPASGFEPSPDMPSPMEPSPDSDGPARRVGPSDDLAGGEIVRVLAPEEGMIIVEN